MAPKQPSRLHISLNESLKLQDELLELQGEPPWLQGEPPWLQCETLMLNYQTINIKIIFETIFCDFLTFFFSE